MKTLKRLCLILTVTICSQANAIVINQTVNGTDNLYFSDWGHIYPEALATPGSNPANVVSFAGSAFDFSGALGVNIFAMGMVVDDGPNATDPDGFPNDFKDGNFRGLPVYSLIGVWSSSFNSIVPIVDPLLAAFSIGSNAFLDIPDVSELYLFLAENDGGFADNSGYYDVTLEVLETTSVPEPASAALLLLGLLGLGFVRSNKKVIL